VSITHDRVELKYKVSQSHAAEFSRGLRAHVTEHRFAGEGANHLPRARHYVTTVYFDTPSRDLYRAVRASDGALKVRAREYYDLHPELLELATHQAEIVRHFPVLWVEIKGKQDGRVYKRRVGIPKRDVAAFYEQGHVSQAMRELQNAQADEVIAELLELRARQREPLRPSCLVNYRRTAFQDAGGSLRITFDQRLACFAPPSDLFAAPRPLLRENLGVARYEEPAIVLEVKHTQQLPTWLDELMQASHAERYAYSKFITASEAVYGAH
jgi:SPX domain protein involved in polyphosphate accumulation